MRFLGVLCVCAAMCSAALGAPLRIASAFDPQTMDPHGLALLYHTRIHTQVYESLIGRDQQFNLEPALALSWQALDPLHWRRPPQRLKPVPAPQATWTSSSAE